VSRENAHAKGRRLLAEGRLQVLDVNEYDGTALAKCRGDSAAMYVVGRDEAGRWTCSCRALGRCSHIVALQLVVVLEPRGES
jgi:uncharacterized Zn finger protein